MKTKEIYLISIFIMCLLSFSCEKGEENKIIIDDVTPSYLSDVKSSFQNIGEQYNYIEANATSNFYFNLTSQKMDLSWNSHIQGIQRLRGSNYFVISGSQWGQERGEFGFIKINSRPIDCVIGKNSSNIIPKEDVVVHRITVAEIIYETNKNYWHAGGISLCGNILAVSLTTSTWEIWDKIVPNYNDKDAMIAFYMIPGEDIYGTYELKECRIIRNKGDDSNSGAVAITRFLTGKYKNRYLVANLAYGNYGPFDFYISETTDIKDGFEQPYFQRLELADSMISGGEGIQFLNQVDGNIFLATLRGKEYTLYKLEIKEEGNYPEITEFKYVSRIYGSDITEEMGSSKQHEVDGFGLYVCPDSESINLYCVSGWTGYVVPIFGENWDLIGGRPYMSSQRFKIFEYPSE